MAGKPRPAKIRAEPASHALAMTKVTPSWSERNDRALSSCVTGMAISCALRAPQGSALAREYARGFRLRAATAILRHLARSAEPTDPRQPSPAQVLEIMNRRRFVEGMIVANLFTWLTGCMRRQDPTPAPAADFPAVAKTPEQWREVLERDRYDVL